MKIKKIKLADLQLDEPFRREVESMPLNSSISEKQIHPLLVEGPTENNTYILVDGYLRYNCLEYSKIPEAYCIIEDVTSVEQRVIKRLKIELHTKKKTGFEMERMVGYLLDHGFSKEQIAAECKVTRETIKKYIKSIDVRDDWKQRAEESGAGRHGLTEISNLKNIKDNIKEYMVDIYVDKSINGYHVELIKKIDSIKEFTDLSDDIQKESLNNLSEIQRIDKEQLKTRIYEKHLQQNYTKKVHDHIFKAVDTLLVKIISYCNHNFTDHLSKNQTKQLHKKINKIASILRLPVYWSKFPDNRDFENKKKNQ